MKLRILQVITRLPIGGAERLVVDISRGLDPARYEALVCCIQARGALASEIEAAGIPLFCLDRMQSRRFDFHAVKDLAALLRRERIDLVHSHLYHANLYARLASMLVGVPSIATVHNTYTRPKLHRRLLNRLLARASARIIAVSDDIRRDLIRYDGVQPGKIATIDNGIDVSRVRTRLSRQEARARLDVGDEALVLVSVARLEEQKGHRYLLEALRLLQALPIQLLLVGDGRLRGALEGQARELGVADRVRFLGSRNDVGDILKGADIYVMPSLWEGLSIAMLEAMSAQLPVVATQVGGVTHVLGNDDCGIRVAPRDARALAEAIRALAGDPGRRAVLGARARQRVDEHFSLEAMLTRLTALYEDAVRAV